MGVLKNIPRENYLVRPFLTHKTQTFEVTYLSGSNTTPVDINLAIVPPALLSWQVLFNSASSPINKLSGIYQETLYASLRHIFYSSASQWNNGTAITIPSGNLFVFSIAQQALGETIKPGTILIDANTLSQSFTDDGNGGLITAVSGSQVIGNVFYDQGIAVLPQTAFPLSSGTVVFIEFDATHTIYEHQIICTIEPGEFNYTFNPSFKATSSFDGDEIKILDKFLSGSLTPYFTTVGCYSSQGELVAIGKVPRPLRRAVDSQQTVIVRFDV